MGIMLPLKVAMVVALLQAVGTRVPLANVSRPEQIADTFLMEFEVVLLM